MTNLMNNEKMHDLAGTFRSGVACASADYEPRKQKEYKKIV